MKLKALVMFVEKMVVISSLSRANFQSSMTLNSVVSVLFCFLYAVKHGRGLLPNECVACLLRSFQILCQPH